MIDKPDDLGGDVVARLTITGGMAAALAGYPWAATGVGLPVAGDILIVMRPAPVATRSYEMWVMEVDAGADRCSTLGGRTSFNPEPYWVRRTGET